MLSSHVKRSPWLWLHNKLHLLQRKVKWLSLYGHVISSIYHLTMLYVIVFYLQLKAHARIHSSNRKMYECPREGCSRVYTKVSCKIQLCIVAATGRFSNDDTTLQHMLGHQYVHWKLKLTCVQTILHAVAYLFCIALSCLNQGKNFSCKRIFLLIVDIKFYSVSIIIRVHINH